MSTTTFLGILIGACIVCVVAAGWALTNSRGYKSRGRRRAEAKKGNRETDTKKLDRRERKLYAQAKDLLARGKVLPAARVMEQINLPREAIQALEDHGEIDEAAKILMRMQRHNRAGVIYARHGMWDKASQCFRLANMPLEAGKCAREAGNYEAAAEFFQKAQRNDDAAECYAKSGKVQLAARLYGSSGNHEEAIKLYRKLAKNAENLATLDLEEPELRFIVEYLSTGAIDMHLVDLVIHRNRIVPVISNAVARGHVKQAADMYLRAPTDIGPSLIAEVSYNDRSAENLAELFLKVSHFVYAGMVYERMEEFDRAGDAFERGEQYDRASYCYDRAGNNIKVKLLKERAKASRGIPQAHAQAKSPERERPNMFALSEVTDQSKQFGAFSPEDEEKTEVLTASSREDDDPPAPSPSFSVPEDTSEIPATESDDTSLDSDKAVFYRARFFSDLDDDQRDRLWSIGITLTVAKNKSILNYNDEPAGVYVITQGRVSVYREIQGEERYVDQMNEAESFGELWLLADQPTAVKFVAATDVKIRVIGRTKFDELLDKDGTIARKLYKRFTMRLLKRLLSPRKYTENKEAS